MTYFKAVLLVFLAFGLAAAEERKRRQVYDGNYGGAAAYRQPQGYQQQPQQYGYQQQQPAAQYAPEQPARRPPPRQHAADPVEEEKDQGPHPLTLLLENSKFECGAKSDGYYADSGVGCQAFHYCVSGQKHSMMCPAGTVFHQVHLNCVPQDQDICNKADKFYFVNDYLNKPLEQRGPNNTVQYAQRYYPENYAVGDDFVPPAQDGRREPPAATYGLGPAYREQQPAPVQQPHHPQPAAPAHRPQHAIPYAPIQQIPAHRPAPYTPQVQQNYARPAQQPAARPGQPQPQYYGYGAQQAQAAHLAQAQQAQRVYAQQQYDAVAPQQHLYGAGAGQRPRYAQQY